MNYYKIRRSQFLIFLILLFLLVLAGQAEMREWTSSAGKKMTAELVSYDKDAAEVTIRKEDDKVYTLGIDKLSEADREWLEKEHGEKKTEEADEESGVSVS